MSAGNRDTVTKTHQLRQHLGAADNRNTRLMRRHDLGVIRRDSARHHHHARVEHVFRAMVEINGGAQRRQLLRDSVRRQIGPADLVAFIRQHFRNTAHTGAADANEVNVPDATHLGHDRTQFRQLLCIHSLKAFGKRHNIINHAEQTLSAIVTRGRPRVLHLRPFRSRREWRPLLPAQPFQAA